MSLHQKIIIHNRANANKQTEDTPSLQLKNVEPTRINTFSKVIMWKNKKLSHIFSTPLSERKLLYTNIEKRNILIDTASDFANLIEVPAGQLLYLLYERKELNYKTFNIKKKNGGERIINAPIGGVKILQNKFKEFLDFFYRPKKSAHGFIFDKSIVTNAKEHKKRKYVINIDLENFFGSITFARIYGIFKNKPFNMGHSAATVAAQLCTYNKVLPQGASTSPVLSNLICTSLDRELMKIAKLYHMKYTRYADDITFSTDKKPNKAIVKKIDESSEYEIGELLKNKIVECGFLINDSKFRVQERSQRQSVTGLIVNEKVNVSRKYIRQTRAMIHQWSKDPENAAKTFLNVGLGEQVDLPSAVIKFRNHIYGRLSFIKMVRGSEFSTYLRLCSFMGQYDPHATSEARRAMNELEMYDLFICHASEDKDDIAIPIYKTLKNRGVTAFIDHEKIKWGDSLTDKINTALAKSKYVMAILSRNSVDKNWPLKEINSVLAKEIGSKKTRLLTLIKDGEQEYIDSKLPLLSDKFYMVYKNDAEDVADKFISRLSE